MFHFTYNLHGSTITCKLMQVTIFVRLPNTAEYSKLGKKEFTIIPRADEYIIAVMDRHNLKVLLTSLPFGADIFIFALYMAKVKNVSFYL